MTVIGEELLLKSVVVVELLVEVCLRDEEDEAAFGGARLRDSVCFELLAFAADVTDIFYNISHTCCCPFVYWTASRV